MMKNIKTALLIVFAAGSFLLNGGELYPAGDFESGNIVPPLSVRRFISISKKRGKAPDGTVEEKIQGEKVINGKQSLLLTAKENGVHEWSLPNMPVTPGRKYRFSVSYLVEEANPGFSIGCRILLLCTGDKPKYIFGNAKIEQGKVMHLQREFTALENTHSVHITLWINQGPYKIYIDDFKLTEMDEDSSAQPRNQ